MSAWLVKTRRAPSRHSRDARVHGHTTTATHKLSTPPPPLSHASDCDPPVGGLGPPPFIVVPTLPRLWFSGLPSPPPSTCSRPSGFGLFATLVVFLPSARLTLSTSPSLRAKRSGVLPGLRFRALLVLFPLSAVTARDPLLDLPHRPHLLLADSFPPPSLLDVDAANPDVAKAVANLARGISDSPSATVFMHPKFWRDSLPLVTLPSAPTRFL